MTTPADRPWLALYGDRPADVTAEHPSMTAAARAGTDRDPAAVAVRYFDGVLTRADLDAQSDALASALLARGLRRGDRVAAYLQNDPQFVVTALATWKAGAVLVPVNPMSRARELTHLLRDSGARVLVALESLHEQVGRDVVPGSPVEVVVTTSELEHQTRHDPRLFAGVPRTRAEGTLDLAALVAEHTGEAPPPVDLGPDDVAVLTYTSGTTGVPKGAMNTHGNLVVTAQVYRDWVGLGPDDSVLGIAPLFHVTGMVGHLAVSLLTPVPLVLAHRFDPGVVLDAVREHRPTFTVGAVTAFTALLGVDGRRREDFASFRAVYSGGAPVSPAAEGRFREATGLPLHGAYGLTETTSPVTMCPLGVDAPVDPTSGALSIGVPVMSTRVRVLGDDGRDLPPGEVGEIAVEGPQVVPGYWGKPEETAAALPDGALRTGDVGLMSPEGWVFLVDRKKDMINASGYKVWPREVEDVLGEHPAVREAAVVGVPDEKRGETVKAFVSLQPGASATPEELVTHCRERMAAYKYPRSVELVDELPKTVTGKILRRELRG